MNHWLSCIIGASLFVLTPAEADEFAHVDPDVLARGIDKLAVAWTIPVVVHTGATDDFAKEFPPLAALPPEVLPETTGSYAGAEDALRDLLAEEDIETVLGEIGRQRRLD